MNEYENMYDCNKKVEDDRLSTIEVSNTDINLNENIENYTSCNDGYRIHGYCDTEQFSSSIKSTDN